jgi:hypothetical protein
MTMTQFRKDYGMNSRAEDVSHLNLRTLKRDIKQAAIQQLLTGQARLGNEQKS